MPQKFKTRPMCLQCKNIVSRPTMKYCCQQCQIDHRHDIYISNWLDGNEKGWIRAEGSHSMSVSRHIRRYLSDIHGEQCWECGWNKKHSTTNKVPLAVDHIDGDAMNCVVSNLRLLCPNCHSLTLNFGALNIGNGKRKRFKN